MRDNQLSIAFGDWVYRYFAPDIEGYCNILLQRIDPVFDDVHGEERRAKADFLDAVAPRHEGDYGGVMEAAHDHAQERAMQFMEMRAIFLTTGVSGLFHLFERQLYRHINKELKAWLQTPLTLNGVTLKM